MNIQLPLGMDKVAFLDWVQGREERYELDRGRVIMMTGGSRAHWQITANLFKALDARIDPQSIDPQRWAVLPEFGVELQSESSSACIWSIRHWTPLRCSELWNRPGRGMDRKTYPPAERCGPLTVCRWHPPERDSKTVR